MSERYYGRAVRLLRITDCVTQGHLARKLRKAGWNEVDQSVISRIETGDRPIKQHEIELICGVLGFSSQDLLDRARELCEREEASGNCEESSNSSESEDYEISSFGRSSSALASSGAIHYGTGSSLDRLGNGKKRKSIR